MPRSSSPHPERPPRACALRRGTGRARPRGRTGPIIRLAHAPDPRAAGARSNRSETAVQPADRGGRVSRRARARNGRRHRRGRRRGSQSALLGAVLAHLRGDHALATSALLGTRARRSPPENCRPCVNMVGLGGASGSRACRRRGGRPSAGARVAPSGAPRAGSRSDSVPGGWATLNRKPVGDARRVGTGAQGAVEEGLAQPLAQVGTEARVLAHREQRAGLDTRGTHDCASLSRSGDPQPPAVERQAEVDELGGVDLVAHPVNRLAVVVGTNCRAAAAFVTAGRRRLDDETVGTRDLVARRGSWRA